MGFFKNLFGKGDANPAAVGGGQAGVPPQPTYSTEKGFFHENIDKLDPTMSWAFALHNAAGLTKQHTFDDLPLETRKAVVRAAVEAFQTIMPFVVEHAGDAGSDAQVGEVLGDIDDDVFGAACDQVLDNEAWHGVTRAAIVLRLVGFDASRLTIRQFSKVAGFLETDMAFLGSLATASRIDVMKKYT